MTKETAATPEQIMGAIKTLANVDLSALAAKTTGERAWDHVRSVLDRYAPSWRSAAPYGASESGSAAYAIRGIVQDGRQCDQETKDKAAAWDNVCHTLDGLGVRWRQVTGETLAKRALVAIEGLTVQAVAAEVAAREIAALVQALNTASPDWASDAKDVPVIDLATLAIRQLGRKAEANEVNGQHSDAWFTVCRVLDELQPKWLSGPGSGLQCAIDAIRVMHTARAKAERNTSTTAINDDFHHVAWHNVALTLDELSPGWNAANGDAVKAATDAIRKLAESPANANWLHIVLALDSNIPGWYKPGVAPALEQAAVAVTNLATQASQKTKDVRVFTHGAVDTVLVRKYIIAAEALVSRRTFAYHVPTPSQQMDYRNAHRDLIEAMGYADQIRYIKAIQSSDPSIPEKNLDCRAGYASGWNAALAAMQNRIALKSEKVSS